MTEKTGTQTRENAPSGHKQGMALTKAPRCL